MCELAKTIIIAFLNMKNSLIKLSDENTSH